MILHGIEYQRPTSLNMRILADHVTYSFLAFMKSIFHFCLGCYCGGYSQNGRSNLSSYGCQCPASPHSGTANLIIYLVSDTRVHVITGVILGWHPANAQSNAVSHWLGTNLESALEVYVSKLASANELLTTSYWNLNKTTAILQKTYP